MTKKDRVLKEIKKSAVPIFNWLEVLLVAAEVKSKPNPQVLVEIRELVDAIKNPLKKLRTKKCFHGGQPKECIFCRAEKIATKSDKAKCGKFG